MSTPDKNIDEVDGEGTNPSEDETYSLAGQSPLTGRATAELDAQIQPVELHEFRRKKSPVSNFWALMGCNLIVFVTSVCIMVLELTASRLIAKHVGSSLYTWTSVIGVVLAGITVGNYTGGWLADRFNHKKTLAWLFLIASILCFSVLWLDQLIPGIDKPTTMGWQYWVLCIVAGIFLLPAIAMGTISPVVASMALSRSVKTGMTVGNVYAWGALGSIVGTFLAGFVLIDLYGTRSIVGMTAGTLAAMGILTAAGQWTYRAAVLFGWLQFIFFIGLAASAESQAFATAGHSVGRLFATAPDDDDDETVEWWTNLGYELGRNFHELGLTLALRNDDPNEYHDESNYSYINVADTTEDGDSIKYLKLDKLIHSYYNPANPTELYYDYEQIYAAITERSATDWKRRTLVVIKFSDDTADAVKKWPAWANYDAEKNLLEITGAMSAQQRDELLAIDPAAAYYKAVEELHRLTNETNWGGFSSIQLKSLPAGTMIPEPLQDKVRYDRNLEALLAYKVVTDKDVERLVSVGAVNNSAAYYQAVIDLFQRSRQTSTMFIGGGGFIFPRWIEERFPYKPNIDVAELDPAVKLAVQQELGLPPDGETAVNTYIGDARNFVDDRLQANKRLQSRNESPVLYDFIYGDAFNDYSVPFHLTTQEFTEKIKLLLDPKEGVYLVNIIDIYPRTVYPGRITNEGEAGYEGLLPEGLFPKTISSRDWTSALSPVEFLQVQSLGKNRYRLRVTRAMTDDEHETLDLILGEGFEDVLYNLYEQSNTPIAFDGTIPKKLFDTVDFTNNWSACESPYVGIEIDRIEAGKYQIGVRGVMADAMRERLLEIEPENEKFATAVEELYNRSRESEGGRFVSSYVNTIREVFPNVYIFSSEIGVPSQYRDTFVIVASMRPLNMANLEEADDFWSGSPFAWSETAMKSGEKRSFGQMDALLLLARGIILTDDYAPVDNLLSPVFKDQN